MKVYIPTPLRSYTGKESVVEAGGATVGEVLADIERRYAGFRFRKIFINGKPVQTLNASVQPDDTIHIMCALSGGV